MTLLRRPGLSHIHEPTIHFSLSCNVACLERDDSTHAVNVTTVRIAIVMMRSFIRLTTPSSATPGRGRGCEHGGARRRRGLCRASWRAAQPESGRGAWRESAVTE